MSSNYFLLNKKGACIHYYADTMLEALNDYITSYLGGFEGNFIADYDTWIKVYDAINRYTVNEGRNEKRIELFNSFCKNERFKITFMAYNYLTIDSRRGDRWNQPYTTEGNPAKTGFIVTKNGKYVEYTVTETYATKECSLYVTELLNKYITELSLSAAHIDQEATGITWSDVDTSNIMTLSKAAWDTTNLHSDAALYSLYQTYDGRNWSQDSAEAVESLNYTKVKLFNSNVKDKKNRIVLIGFYRTGEHILYQADK